MARWLEYFLVSFWDGLFQGLLLLVSGSVNDQLLGLQLVGGGGWHQPDEYHIADQLNL